MQILLIGINHKITPVDIRQRLACDTALIYKALRQLSDRYPGSEFVLLSTCNRVECYAAVSKTTGPTAIELAKWLADFRSADFREIEQHLSIKMNEDAARHLFMVTSSLDSMVIGESQITSQVKESYKIACKCSTTGKILNRLFHEAFRTNKEIIAQTSISSRRVSVAGVAVELAKQLFSDVRSTKAVIVGAGQMGQLLVEHFQHEQCRDITVVNRSKQRGCKLAEQSAIRYQPWEVLDEEIVKANIVVGAASANEGYLFNKEQMKSLMNRRRYQMLLIIDITVPRSFDPLIGKIENVYLYSIDDLAEVARDNIKLRQEDMEKAIEIICGSVSSFTDWFVTREVGPLIGKIKDAFERVGEIELEKFLEEITGQDDRRETMQNSMRKIVNKLCHCIIKNIDSVSKEYGPAEAEKFAESILADATQMLDEEKRNLNEASY